MVVKSIGLGLAGEAVTDPQKNAQNLQSDFFAIANGYVSITPIQMDATNYTILETLQSQLSHSHFDV